VLLSDFGKTVIASLDEKGFVAVAVVVVVVVVVAVVAAIEDKICWVEEIAMSSISGAGAEPGIKIL